MIYGVYANQPSFHQVEFTPGLNVVLAERTDLSTQRDTRNGLGKSTLIEIIDFCLGGAGKGLRIEALTDWAFTLDVNVGGNRVRATRAVASHNRIVVDGRTDGWPERPDLDSVTGERVFSLEKWRAVLGWALFRVPRSEHSTRYRPSYRGLVSYYLRRGPAAYSDPFSHFRQQKTWDVQLHVAFLLGLNWEYPGRWQELKDQEQAVAAIAKAVQSGAVEKAWGSLGELQAEAVELEQQVALERRALADFHVHPQYDVIQAEADQLTAQIHRLLNENVSDRRRLARYRDSVAEEMSPSGESLEQLYEEAGLILPPGVRRTLREAREFHRRVVENRRAFLDGEIGRLGRDLQARGERIRELTDVRARSLGVLQSHGALEEMTRLQDRLVETEGRLRLVLARISEMKDASSRRREIRLAKTELERLAEHDHEERREVWASAVSDFNDNSQALYSTPGRLVIDITETGYQYDVEINRSGSEGIGKMKVFCFDLMLLQQAARARRGIDFLVHDSLLYDGVDSRQRALALERASQVSKSLGCQYICALNSDMIPRDDFSADFDFDSCVRLTLRDKDPSGSLLGFQFERTADR